MNASLKYLLVEPKIKAVAPNIALMKRARWCELNGREYQHVRGIVAPKIIPDHILMSCVFSYHSKLYENTINHYLKLFPDAKIRKLPNQYCIHDLKPEHSRAYPKSREHALETGCQGFKA